MIEGWHNNEYFVLFEDRNEAVRLTERYGLSAALPGHLLIGFKGWDDFILQNAKNEFFTVPTVPLDPSYVRPFELNINPSAPHADQRFAGKIKWYVKPVVFGGNPSDGSNIVWIPLEQHIEAVKWWNQMYWNAKREKPAN